MPTCQHANMPTCSWFLHAWHLLLSVSLVLGPACQSTATGQTVIDVDSKVEIQFDGESEAELSIKASLIDGFTYHLPVELTVGEGVELDDLGGKIICQCASLQFEKKSIASKNEVVNGQILLRPKSADLVQTLDAFGTRSCEHDPVRIGRVRVNCKVYSPLRFLPVGQAVAVAVERPETGKTKAEFTNKCN